MTGKRTPLRSGLSAALAMGSLAALALMAAGASAQRSDGLFSLIRDDARAHSLRQAQGKLAAGETREAIDLLLEVLRASPSAVIDRNIESYVGLREAARSELARLPPDARTIYERLVTVEAAPLLRDALLRANPEELARLALRYPHASPARTARLAAGDAFLEQARVLRAFQEFSLLEDRHPTVVARRMLCRRLLGMPDDPEPVLGNLPFGELELPIDQWRERCRGMSSFGLPASYWPAYGGGLDGTRLAAPPVAPSKLVWQKPIEYLESEYPSDFTHNIFPVADGRRVYVNTGTKLYGFDLLDGRAWQSVGLIADEPPYERNEYMLSVSPHQAHSAALGAGLVVAPLQVPIIPDIAKEGQQFNGIQIMVRLPVRRLHAFEQETGRLVWSHYDRVTGAPSHLAGTPIDVSGPPIIVDDTVYVATHRQLGTIAFYLSAFDVRTGKLRWKTLLCSSQIEVNMFGNAQLEYAASPLCYSDGVLYGATNLGLAFSVRADDGSIRWLQSYPIIRMPRSRMRIDLRTLYWANNAPIVTGGGVVMTPIDSESAFCLETDTGNSRWRLSHEVFDEFRRHRTYELRWLLGAHQDAILFAGQAIVAMPVDGRGPARLLATPQTLGQDSDGDSQYAIPRGLLTEHHIYYLSATGGLKVLDYDGRVVNDERQTPDLSEIGSLCSSGGVLTSVRPRFVNGYYSIHELITRAGNETRLRPTDPEPALAYAELLAARPDLNPEDVRRVIAQYRTVLELCERSGRGPASPLALRAKFGLYLKLRDLGEIHALTRPDAARQYRLEAATLGRELFLAGALLEKDLIRFYAALLHHYQDVDANVRDLVLQRLESDHAAAEYSFDGVTSTKVGLFVLLTRLDALADDEPRASARLALLRRILLEHPESSLPAGQRPTRGRDYALAHIQDLLRRYGRGIYATYEAQARQLLATATEDASQLQLILDQFPCSESAATALVRIGELAATRGDLAAAIRPLRFALTRLPAPPPGLLDAVQRTALVAGNRRLHAALANTIAGHPPHDAIAAPLVLPERLAQLPTDEPRHEPQLGTQRYSVLPILHVADFPGPTDVPLFLARAGALHAFAPLTRRFDQPDFSLSYAPPVNALRAAICGDLLVLPEDDRLRGVSLADGKVRWVRNANEDAARDADTWLLGGPLANGLYGVCRTARDFSQRRSLTVTGIEPLTGEVVFERTIAGSHAPAWINGRFVLQRTESDDTRTLVLLDLLSGHDALRLPLDGRAAPRIRQDIDANVLVTANEIFILATDDTAPEGQIGLYCFDRRLADGEELPRRLWYCPAPRASAGDACVVSGGEVLLTLGFHSGTSGRIWRLDRATGQRRRDIACDYEARMPRFPYPECVEIPPGPILVVGHTESDHAQLTLLDTRPTGVSWSVTVPRGQVQFPLPEDFPAPAYTDDAMIFAHPIVRNRDRFLSFLVFKLATGERTTAPAMRPCLWNEPAQTLVWNRDLLVRSQQNAWIFPSTIAPRK